MPWFSKIRLGGRGTLSAETMVASDLPFGLRRQVLLTLANPARAAALAVVAVLIAAEGAGRPRSSGTAAR